MGNNSAGNDSDYTVKSNADLSTKLGFCVKQTTNKDEVALVSAATDPVFGILLNKPKAAGRAAHVRTRGKCVCVSDGSGTAIAVGDLVGPDANGRVVKKATADFNAIGRANEPSSALGTEIEVWLGLPQQIFRTLAG